MPTPRAARRALPLAALLAALALPAAAHAQSSSAAAGARTAAWVVAQFYERKSFPTLRDHVTGEFAAYAAAPTMGSRLPARVAVTSRPLRQGASTAVFATAVRDAGQAQDWYTFLRRDGGRWKIEAVRTLVVPPAHRAALNSMETRAAARSLPDSLQPTLEAMRLFAASDSALAAYVAAHRPALLGLAREFAARPRLTALTLDGVIVPDGAVPAADADALAARMRALPVRALFRDAERPRCVRLKVGGNADDTVGFLYAPSGCTPPAVTSTKYIYVAPAGEGWYVYKTT